MLHVYTCALTGPWHTCICETWTLYTHFLTLRWLHFAVFLSQNFMFVYIYCQNAVKYKIQKHLLFSASDAGGSETGMESWGMGVEGKWKCQPGHMVLTWDPGRVPFPDVAQGPLHPGKKQAIGRLGSWAGVRRWTGGAGWSGYLETSSSDIRSCLSSVSSLLTSQKSVALICKMKKIVTSSLYASPLSLGPRELIPAVEDNVTPGGDCVTQVTWDGTKRVTW